MTNSTRIKAIAIGKLSFSIMKQLQSQSMKGIDFMFANTEAEVHSSKNCLPKHNTNLQYNLLDKTVFNQTMEDNTQISLILTVMNSEEDKNNASKIARWSKEKGLFTIGMLALPPKPDKSTNYWMTQSHIEALRNDFDSMSVINYNKISNSHAGLLEQSFVPMLMNLCEIITTSDITYNEIPTGEIFIGCATKSSASRAQNAIESAFSNALIPVEKLKKADKVVLLISSGNDEITLDEIGLINDYIQEQTGYGSEIVMAVNEELELGTSIKISVIISVMKTSSKQPKPFDPIKTSIISLDGQENIIFENKQAVEERKNSIKKWWLYDSID